MRLILPLIALGIVASTVPVCAQQAAAPNSAAKAAPATEEITVTGQRPVTPDTSYWVEDALPSYPLLGVNFAQGLIIWNHPDPWNHIGTTVPPIRAMEGMAALGWDIIRLQRNSRLTGGLGGWPEVDRVVAALTQQVEEARAKGYKRIILAGQDVGGALSLEAGKKIDGLYAIIAFAPNTGIKWKGYPRAFTPIPTDEWTEVILEHTWDQLEHLSTGRLLVLFPTDDEQVPHVRGPTARDILARRGDLPFVLIDESSGVRGTAGADTADFDSYASCMDLFLSPDLAVRPGEFHCGADEVPLALAQMGVKPHGGETWFGYSSLGQAIYAETPAGSARSLIYGWGSGANGKTKPGFKALDVKVEGETIMAALTPDQMIRGVRHGALLRLTVDQEDGTRVSVVMRRLTGGS
jgi:hypothetical protein